MRIHRGSSIVDWIGMRLNQDLSLKTGKLAEKFSSISILSRTNSKLCMTGKGKMKKLHIYKQNKKQNVALMNQDMDSVQRFTRDKHAGVV